MQVDKRRRNRDSAVNIKRDRISKFAYRVSMSSFGPIQAVDYFVVISFCVKDARICLLSHPLDPGTLE